MAARVLQLSPLTLRAGRAYFRPWRHGFDSDDRGCGGGQLSSLSMPPRTSEGVPPLATTDWWDLRGTLGDPADRCFSSRQGGLIAIDSSTCVRSFGTPEGDLSSHDLRGVASTMS